MKPVDISAKLEGSKSRHEWQVIFTLAIIVIASASCGGIARQKSTQVTTTNPPAPPETVKASIEGIVLGGGDKSPANRMGGPRLFIFEVRSENGEIILVTYTAMPPSLTGGQRLFRLDFYAGKIQAGDYLKAFGSFNPSTLTLTIQDEGDYIETYPTKP